PVSNSSFDFGISLNSSILASTSYALLITCMPSSVGTEPKRDLSNNLISSSSSRSEEHTSELQSRFELVCRLLLEKKKFIIIYKKNCNNWIIKNINKYTMIFMIDDLNCCIYFTNNKTINKSLFSYILQQKFQRIKK